MIVVRLCYVFYFSYRSIESLGVCEVSEAIRRFKRNIERNLTFGITKANQAKSEDPI